MDFIDHLLDQLRLHPSMQPQDVIKLCYQAARGAEHLLDDTARARAYFDAEYDATPAYVDEQPFASRTYFPFFEPISEKIARASLAVWKAAGFPAEWLFRMFVHTASVPTGEEDLLERYIAEVTNVVSDEWGPGRWDAAVAAWREAGMPPVHHSEEYRAAEKPAYRIVNRDFRCILPILWQLMERPDVRVIAIDGRAASGKTTKAALLSAALDAPVIHMDDFFLPPALRTSKRLEQPGGNVHYERFAEEVLPGLASGEDFTYRVFDCSRKDFHGLREIPAAPIRIVEGSYCLHPELGDYADLRVFSTVDYVIQLLNILHRDGKKMEKMFRTRWIPMEEKYFAHFAIREKADIVL